MTPLLDVRNTVIEHALTGQIVNRQQDHHLANTTEDIDSLAEILIALDAADDPMQRRRLVTQGLRLIKHIRSLNDTEHGCEREIAGSVEQFTPEMAAAKQRWTIKRLAAELRPLLADLANPALGQAKRTDRMARLVKVIDEAPPENIKSVWLRNELGKAKSFLLNELVAEVRA